MERVLHVERRLEVSRWVRTVLETAGFEVTTEECGEAAIQRLATADFDFVLVSLETPAKPSDSIIEWIAANRPHLLSRVLTVDMPLRPGGSTMLESRETPLLFAPFSTGELAERVKSLLTVRPADPRRRSTRRGHAMAC